MRIGITGGIGSGKSYVCRLLEKRGFEIYDCDSAAKRLMRTSDTLRQQLCHLVGPDAYRMVDGGWQLDKAVVARFLLASEANTQAINAIVHPAVFSDFEQSGMCWIESALMFESGLNRRVDRVVAVTAPREVRIARIVDRDRISPEKAEEWIARQWPQEKVRRMADDEIINDGRTPLDPQINSLLEKYHLKT